MENSRINSTSENEELNGNLSCNQYCQSNDIILFESWLNIDIEICTTCVCIYLEYEQKVLRHTGKLNSKHAFVLAFIHISALFIAFGILLSLALNSAFTHWRLTECNSDSGYTIQVYYVRICRQYSLIYSMGLTILISNYSFKYNLLDFFRPNHVQALGMDGTTLFCKATLTRRSAVLLYWHILAVCAAKLSSCYLFTKWTVDLTTLI